MPIKARHQSKLTCLNNIFNFLLNEIGAALGALIIAHNNWPLTLGAVLLTFIFQFKLMLNKYLLDFRTGFVTIDKLIYKFMQSKVFKYFIQSYFLNSLKQSLKHNKYIRIFLQPIFNDNISIRSKNENFPCLAKSTCTLITKNMLHCNTIFHFMIYKWSSRGICFFLFFLFLNAQALLFLFTSL